MTHTDIDKQFDEKVNEIRYDDINVTKESPVREFGYKVLRDDEVFTITDFGNIKKFIHLIYDQAKAEQREEDAKIAEENLPEKKTGQYWYTRGDVFPREVYQEACDDIASEIRRNGEKH